MAEAVGPVFTGGFEEIASSDGNDKYTILFLADKHNDDLQREGKPPVYYWMPNGVRIARKGDTGDYKFHLIHFVGVQSSDTTVGVAGTREVAGGVLSVTTTSAFPAGVLENAQQQLLKRFQGKDDRYWGWRTPVAPMFRPVPIVANITAISNLAPDANGMMPATGLATPGPTPAPDGSAPASGPAPSGGVPSGGAPSGGPPAGPGAPRSVVASRDIAPARSRKMPRTVPFTPRFTGRDTDLSSNLNAWYFHLQGQGPGSIDPEGENAYSGLVGSLPAAILWQGFHGEYSPLAVSQSLKFQVWTQSLRITVDGNWDRIFDHFSASAKGRYLWFSGDINVELNNLMINGGITVHMEIDGTVPGADKMREEASKRIDAIRESFMKQAEKRIFDPAPPDVKPAEASDGGILSGIFGWGGGFALKYRRDETQLNLHYEETVDTKYLQDTVISSTLEGFYDEIKKDPNAEQKYFTTLYLDDWDRKVTRMVKPVVNWPDPTKKWVGEPVAFVSVQIGYPSANGDVQWAGHAFQSTDTGDATSWQVAMAKKNAGDVVNPPDGWAPDITYIRRQIHFNEPPGETEYPNMRVFVEQNIVDLDPGDHGTPTDLNTLEVRADSAGKLEVGPITLNVDLESSKQVIEVEFKALGQRADGTERGITRFSWAFDDQIDPRYWSIFTGQLDYQPVYQYRVHVVVKGSIFSKGMEWYGPWIDVSGNGPLMISVPTQDDASVTTRRSLTPQEISGTAPIGNGAKAPAQADTHTGPPATTTSTTRPAVSGPPSTRTAPPASGPPESRTAPATSGAPKTRTAVSGPPHARTAPTTSGYSTAPAEHTERAERAEPPATVPNPTTMETTRGAGDASAAAATGAKSTSRRSRSAPASPPPTAVMREEDEGELVLASGWSSQDPDAGV